MCLPLFLYKTLYESRKQMKDFGAMLSFELKSGREGAFKFVNTVKLFSLGESLGTVYFLVNHPASMTHASIPKEVREKNGITEGLFRLSIGCENEEDLIEDFSNALKVAK